MVKKLYGTSVLVDEINDILSTSLNDYIKAQEFKLLGDPLPVLSTAENIDWKNQKDFEFEYKIGFLENLDVKVDESIQVKDYVLELNETEVNDAIGNLRSQYGKMTNPDRKSTRLNSSHEKSSYAVFSLTKENNAFIRI